MKIYVMRHGDAAYRAPSDAERPLTNHGLAEAEHMGHWLARTEPRLRFAWYSPYLRAEQTLLQLQQQQSAQLHASVERQLVPMGDPGHIRDLIAVFALENPGQPLLLVSHMPLVAELTAELVPGCEPPLFVTGAVAEIDWQVDSFSGQLVKLHTPATISQLA